MLEKKHIFKRVLIMGMLMFPLIALGQTPAPTQILIKNVRVFDGTSDKLTALTAVLVVGNKVKEISKNAAKSAAKNASIIDGGGRVLIPGLSDTHTHMAFVTLPMVNVLNGLPSYNHIHATIDAKDMLMRGVTTASDMGGASFGLKKAIDEGLVAGPRIYPSGTIISQTGGHADFRYSNQDNPRFGAERMEADQENYFRVVDGVPEMLVATRENLRHGASQIKISQTNNTITAPLQNIPHEVRGEINTDINEIQKTFNAGCYRSCMILCGRVIEVALHRKYFDATGQDILEKSPGIGLGTLLAKMREKEVFFDPGLMNQIHLINMTRIFSVHKKQDPFIPSKEQTQATIIYTMDILKKLF